MFYSVLVLGYVSQLFNKRILFFAFAAVLILLGCFRYGIGLDYFAYQYLFERLHNSPLYELKYGMDQQEVGFRVLGSFLKNIGFTYQMYTMAFAVVTIIFIAKICSKYSKNPTLSLLIFFSFYYLTWTFNGIRQGVVIAVGLYYLLTCLEKRQFKRFVAIVVLLSLIHSSALILILLYFVARLNLNKKKLITFTIFSIILSVIPIGTIISKLTWFPFYYRILPYLNTETSLNILDFQGLGRILFLIIAFAFYETYSKKDETSRKIINIYIVSLAMYFLLQFSELTAARMTIYGKFLDIIILANILYMYKKRINRLIYIYGIFILCSLYLFKESGEINRGIVGDYFVAPYVTIFNKDDYNFSSRFYYLKDY